MYLIPYNLYLMERLKSTTVQPHFFRFPNLPEGLLSQSRLVLKKVLVRYMGLTLTREQPSLTVDDIEGAGLLPQLKEVARLLGVKDTIPPEASPVGTEVNSIAIALDEEAHFNQYRLLTLNSSLYAEPLVCQLKRYKTYCQREMGKVSRQGRGIQKDPPQCEFKGSYRQVQLALNDFMQDMLPLVHYVPLLRLSVFDPVSTPAGFRTLSSLMEKDDPKEYPLIAGFMEEKLTQLESSFCLDY